MGPWQETTYLRIPNIPEITESQCAIVKLGIAVLALRVKFRQYLEMEIQSS